MRSQDDDFFYEPGKTDGMNSDLQEVEANDPPQPVLKIPMGEVVSMSSFNVDPT